MCINQKAPGRTCCANTGGELFFDYMKSKLVEMDLHGPGKYRISKSGCLGRCNSGPCLVIYPEGIWYRYTSLDDIDQIINSHLIAGKPIQHLLIDNEA